jgi:hypothetical protein
VHTAAGIFVDDGNIFKIQKRRWKIFYCRIWLKTLDRSSNSSNVCRNFPLLLLLLLHCHIYTLKCRHTLFIGNFEYNSITLVKLLNEIMNKLHIVMPDSFFLHEWNKFMWLCLCLWWQTRCNLWRNFACWYYWQSPHMKLKWMCARSKKLRN